MKPPGIPARPLPAVATVRIIPSLIDSANIAEKSAPEEAAALEAGAFATVASARSVYSAALTLLIELILLISKPSPENK